AESSSSDRKTLIQGKHSDGGAEPHKKAAKDLGLRYKFPKAAMAGPQNQERRVRTISTGPVLSLVRYPKALNETSGSHMLSKNTANKKMRHQRRRNISPLDLFSDRYGLVKTMIKMHQAATLTVGSVAAYISRVNGLSQAEKTAIGKVIQDFVDIDNFAKRETHIALVLYIKQEGYMGLGNIGQVLLKHRVESNDMEVDKEDDKNQDGDEFGRANISKFFRTLLTNICNDMNPRAKTTVQHWISSRNYTSRNFRVEMQ
ncbi:hypothetical protein BGX27_009119, partial [Mortierella sp. AM989]